MLRPLAALCLLGLLACDRNIEPYVPGETVQPPDLSRIFPEGAERAAQANPAPAMPAAPPAAAAAAATGEPIRGTVELAPELRDRAPGGAVLFVIARGGPGPPVAAKRIPAPDFPLDFELGPDDRMIQAIPFEGPLQLSARLDSDGNATTRTPGDLAGATQGPAEPGQTGVRIVIDQVL